MPDSRFLQIHTLTSFSGVLLNRDETGAAKRMPYGGAVRTRISSQCLKRHWRTAADEWSIEEEADKSLRTRHIFEKQLHQAVKRHTNAPDEIVEAVGKAVTVMLYGREPVKERQAMLFGRPEIQAIERLSISLVQDAVAAGADAKAACQRAEERIKEQKKNLSSMKDQAGSVPAVVSPGRRRLTQLSVAEMSGRSVFRHRDDRRHLFLGGGDFGRRRFGFRQRQGRKWIGGECLRHCSPSAGMASMAAIFRAASTCESPKRWAARLMTSPPFAPVAKSAQRPLRRLILNEPGRLSARVGFRATHSKPHRLPSGSHRFANAGRLGSDALLMARKAT
jgi:CT1975-like protein